MIPISADRHVDFLNSLKRDAWLKAVLSKGENRSPTVPIVLFIFVAAHSSCLDSSLNDDRDQLGAFRHVRTDIADLLTIERGNRNGLGVLWLQLYPSMLIAAVRADFDSSLFRLGQPRSQCSLDWLAGVDAGARPFQEIKKSHPSTLQRKWGLMIVVLILGIAVFSISAYDAWTHGRCPASRSSA